LPNRTSPYGLRYSGVFKNQVNGRTQLYDDGVLNQTMADAALTLAGASSGGSTQSLSGAYTSTVVGSAFVAATGNVVIGNPGVFATTQPQGAVVMGGSSLGGIAPVGAITTAGAVFASDTVVRKIIAAGTASNVET
jgi:hypothetical protein